MSELAAWDSFYGHRRLGSRRADWITVRSGDADRAKADASGTGRLGCVWHTDQAASRARSPNALSPDSMACRAWSCSLSIFVVMTPPGYAAPFSRRASCHAFTSPGR